MISLTRVYRFSASHRLHSRELSAARNAELFGKCNNPYGHGHDYTLSVTVRGRLDERTGLLIRRERLDALVRDRVLHLFAHRNINADVPQFEKSVATTENIALVIADLLKRHWDEYLGETDVHLQRVHIQETGRNAFEALMPVPPTKKAVKNEGLLVHA